MRAVHSAKDLEALFQDVLIVFSGKETEHNWKSRDNCCNDFRKFATENEAPKKYHHVFVAGVKQVLDGIVSCVISERTTLSNHACDLVQGLAQALGPSIHPMLDILMPPLIRLCAAARKISSKAGNSTVSEIVVSSRTYNSRLLHHVASACTDKNDAPRIYAAAWLLSLMQLHGHQIEQTGGLPVLEKSLKLGLNDAHLEARESARSTYWAFAGIWPQRAEDIMSTLDPQKQKALQDHSSNPNKISKQADKGSRGSTLAEMRAQAKKELQAKRAATPNEETPFVIGLDPGRFGASGQSQDKKKQVLKSKPEAQNASATTRHQQPLHPIRNPVSVESLTNHTEPTQPSSRSRTKGHESQKSTDSASSERSRPLMAAPVRRAVRVVSKSAIPPRPASREEQITSKEVKPPTPASRPASRDDQVPIREHKAPTAAVRAPPRDDHHQLRETKPPTPSVRTSSRNEQHYMKDLKHSTPSLRPAPHEVRVPMKDVKPSINTMSVETKSWASPPIKQSKSFDSRSRNVPKYDVLEDNLHAHHQPVVRRDSPDSQAQLQLHSCLKRIRKGDLSVLGYGKLRRLIDAHGNRLLANDQQFHEVMEALLTAAESPSSDDYRFAIVSVLRPVALSNEAAARLYQSRVMTLLLTSRGFLDDQDHKVGGLEDTAQDIIAHCDDVSSLARVVLDLLEGVNLDPSVQSTTRSIIFGTQCLASLFSRSATLNMDVQELAPGIDRSVAFATRCMHTFNPRVRHATIELCVVLQQVMGEEQFEQAFGTEEGTMNMVAYYANRTSTSEVGLGVS